MVNTSLDGRFLARSPCEKEHRCKISHLRRMEPSKCRLPMAQPFTCCTVEQGWDKHIKGHRFSTFHKFRNSLSLKRAVFFFQNVLKIIFGINFRCPKFQSVHFLTFTVYLGELVKTGFFL